MIAARTDYDFVTIDAGVRVDGGIMPARDQHGESYARVLRGEDVAFALEGACERATVAGTALPSWRSVDMKIISGRWHDAIEAIHGSAASAVKKDTSLMARVLPGALDPAATLLDIYDGIALPQSELISSVNDFGTGYGLRGDAVRNVFHDLDAVRMFACNGTWSRTTDEFTSSQGGGADHAHASATGATLYHHIATNWGPDYPRLEGGWETAAASGGVFVFAHSGSNYTAGGQGAVELEVRVWEGAADAEPEWQHYHVIVARNVNLDADDSIQIGTLAGMAESLAGAYARIKTHSDLEQFTTQEVVVVIRSARAILRLGDHTDFSNINWQWPIPAEGDN